MKAVIYSVPGELTEAFAIANIQKKHNITLIADPLNPCTILFCKGKTAVVVCQSTEANEVIMQKFNEFGVKYLLIANENSTGINFDVAKSFNIRADFLRNHNSDNTKEVIENQVRQIFKRLNSWDINA